MKWIRHSITLVAWTLIAVHAALMVATHTPWAQRRLGGAVAAAIAGKLGTRVEVGRVDLGFLNRLIIDDARVFDQQGKPMLQTARISVRIDVLPLLRHGRVAVTSAQLFGARLTLYRASATAKPNYQFALDSLASKDSTAQKPFDVRVNSFIMRHGSLAYDRLDAAPTHGRLNTAHLRLTDINANMQLRALTPDTLNATVRKLSLKEQSGLAVERLAFSVEAGATGARLADFTLRLPHSALSIPSVEASYRLADGKKPAPGSLRYKGAIGPSTLRPDDFGWLLPSLRSTPQALRLSARLSGTDKEASLDGLTLDGLDGGLALQAKGKARATGGKPQWEADIEGLRLSGEALQTLAQMLGTQLPAAAQKLGDTHLAGTLRGSEGTPLEADVRLTTMAGEADAAFALARDKTFKGSLLAKDVALGALLGTDAADNLTAALDLKGSLADTKRTDIAAKGTIDRLTLKGYDYTGVELDGHYTPEAAKADLRVNDPNLQAHIEGSMERHGQLTAIDLAATIDNLRPQALHLSQRWGDARFSGTLTAKGQGTSPLTATGRLTLKDFDMRSDEGDYHLGQLDLASGSDAGRQYVTLNADFGHAEIVGHFDHATVAQSLLAALDQHLPSLLDTHAKRTDRPNDFLVNAELHDTQWLEKALRVPLHGEGTMRLTGKIDDSHRHHYLNGSAPRIEVAGQRLDDIRLALTSTTDALDCTATLTRVTANDRLALSLAARAQADSLHATASWGNTAKKSFNGQLNAVGHLDKHDGHRHAEISVLPSKVSIDGKQWAVSPSTIVAGPERVGVRGFAIRHGEQHLTLNGTASKSLADTLTADLNGIDVAYVLDLVNFHSVDFGGLASGRAYVAAPFGDMRAAARLTVEDFTFEDGRMGTLLANAAWNGDERRIDLHAAAHDGPLSATLIDGFITPSPGYIDLDIEARGTQLHFMRSLTSAFLSDIGGKATGGVRLHGPLKAIDLTGRLVVDGHATIEATGCTYYLTGDTVTLTPGEITLDRAAFTDRLAGHGRLSGGIHHQHLSRISYDLEAEAEDMLVYDFKDFGEQTFYATVYATGSVGIFGGGDRGLYMDVNVTPRRNSTFTYNVADPDAVASQEFVRWNDGAATSDPQARDKAGHAAPPPTRSDTRIDFAINMTPDATIRLLMDSKTKDYITLTGHGAINASYYNKGSFDMFGTYNVTGGTYGITIQNIIRKYFQFNDGGTITFRGDPYEADLNLQASYTVNGVSLSDLNIGNSFTGNTIRVNCLMNITGQPNSPSVDFDMDLPTVSADEKQLIRSVINSEDEMNQQVLYLLGIGRFYPQGVNNANAQDERQQDQTSLAMQSLLSGTISSQLNSVLGQVIKSNDWTFGANISTGDEGWNNAEYEGLLSGRMLNNRLLFNGQFGYRDNAATANTSFIGDFDIRYLLLPNGNLALRMYNQANDRYFTKSSLNTQGLGLIMKKDFDSLGDLFGRKKKGKGNVK